MQSAPGSLAIDFSEEFALQLTLGRAHASVRHGSVEVSRHTPHAHHVQKDLEAEQLIHPQHPWVNSVEILADMFAKFCKQLVHGHRQIVHICGTAYAYHGIDDFLLNDKETCKILQEYALNNYKHAWDGQKKYLHHTFKLKENMAHQIVRSFLHLHREGLQEIIKAYAKVFTTPHQHIKHTKMFAKETLERILHATAQTEKTYNTWDAEIFKFLRENNHVIHTLHGALLSLHERIIFLEWCCDWKNERYLIDLPYGPMHILLQTQDNYVAGWRSYFLDSMGNQRMIYAKRLYDQDSQLMWQNLTRTMRTNSRCSLLLILETDSHRKSANSN